MLLDLGKSAGTKLVLFPTSDALVKMVSDNRQALGEFYRFVLPERDVVDLLLDKTAFHSWALRLGFPVPESYIAASPDELEAVLNSTGYPCLLKPVFHTDGWNVSPRKIFRLDRKEDISSIPFALFQASPKFLVQQWISGGDSDIRFCLFYFDRKGNEAGHYIGRKVFQHPSGTGSTALCMSSSDSEVYRLAKAVFTSAGFTGLGSLELKLDRKSGSYYIIEPTVGRHDLQSYLAVAGGVNLTLMALHDALETGSQVATARKNATWVDEYNMYNALRHMRRGEFRMGNFVSSVRINTAFSSFSTHDPMPFLHYFGKRLMERRRGKKEAD